MYDILQLNEMLVPELKELAESLELKGYKRLSKQDLIYKILDHQAVVGGDEMPANYSIEYLGILRALPQFSRLPQFSCGLQWLWCAHGTREIFLDARRLPQTQLDLVWGSRWLFGLDYFCRFSGV